MGDKPCQVLLCVLIVHVEITWQQEATSISSRCAFLISQGGVAPRLLTRKETILAIVKSAKAYLKCLRGSLATPQNTRPGTRRNGYECAGGESDGLINLRLLGSGGMILIDDGRVLRARGGQALVQGRLL